MRTIPACGARHQNTFQAVAEPFLQSEGLPFAEVLSAESIERVFREENALFAHDDIYSTDMVLWAFLAQALRDGKNAACASAVADIATYMRQNGQRPPSGDTGDYCRARAKLNLSALRRLVMESAGQLEGDARPAWLWKGRHAKLVDGFTFIMPDTPANQRAFPQPSSQLAGVGFPMARCCAVISLATACVCDLAIGPCIGKQTGESALLRGMLSAFAPGDVVVFDRYYCSYWMLALLGMCGVDVCTRQHQLRAIDFRRGRRLGPHDHLITWTRPVRPAWMSELQYKRIPETLTLREIRYRVTVPGRRTKALTVVTSLSDPNVYTREDIAELYGCRWSVELDIRSIKQTLGLDQVRCKSPSMVRRELWVTILAYNLIRKVIVTAAAVHCKQPRRLGFTLGCQTILSSWMLCATRSCRDPGALCATILAQIAANTVADRPGRIEPRVIKRRRDKYKLMQAPRDQLRAQLVAT